MSWKPWNPVVNTIQKIGGAAQTGFNTATGAADDAVNYTWDLVTHTTRYQEIVTAGRYEKKEIEWVTEQTDWTKFAELVAGESACGLAVDTLPEFGPVGILGAAATCAASGAIAVGNHGGSGRIEDVKWLTDWDEAAKHPRRTRIFLFGGFTALGLFVEALAGFLDHGWGQDVGFALLFGAGLSALVEPFVRSRFRGDRMSRDFAAVVQRQLVVAVIFAVAAATGIMTGSVLAAGLVAGGGIAALSVSALSKRP